MDGTGMQTGFGQTNQFNKTAKTIGSIRNQQVNYSPEHTFFSNDTHMMPKARGVRPGVISDIDRDLLGCKADRWN